MESFSRNTCSSGLVANVKMQEKTAEKEGNGAENKTSKVRNDEPLCDSICMPRK